MAGVGWLVIDPFVKVIIAMLRDVKADERVEKLSVWATYLNFTRISFLYHLSISDRLV